MRKPSSGLRFVAVFVAGLLVASGPQVAIAAFDAVNAHKVDGRHAVGSGASKAKRAGKLVATNASGVLPNNIIAKAPDANLLDGLDSAAFQRRVTGDCPAGQYAAGVTAAGSLTCRPDSAGTGDAQTLDGLDGADFQRRVTGTCASGQFAVGVEAGGALTCDADQVDGGDAQTLDGLDSAAFGVTAGATLVTVRGDGTPTANGAALRDAVDAITTATLTTPYVVQLAPGTYSLGSTGLTLPDNVSLVGAGRRATRITSSAVGVQPDGALALGNNSELARLSFTNQHSVAGMAVAIGVPHSVTARIVDVSVRYLAVSGFAVLATTSSVDIVASHVRSDFIGESATVAAVFGYQGATVRVAGSDIELDAPTSTNEGAVYAQGLGTVVEVANSSITSSGRVARVLTGATNRIANTRLDGTTTGLVESGTIVCFGTYDASFEGVSCSG